MYLSKKRRSGFSILSRQPSGRLFHAMCLLAVSVLSTACVETAIEPKNTTDSTPDITQEDMFVAQDMGKDLSSMDMKDMNPCGVCCPGAKMCQANGTLGTCKLDGSGFDEVACGEKEECVGQACVTKKICEPGTSTCFDEKTQLICRPSGTDYSTMACEDGKSCNAGQCVSGQSNGAACTKADDCSGQKCHCGADESCNSTLFDRAYCTGSCDGNSGCSDNEWCFASDIHKITSPMANYNHCVSKCQGSCAIAGLECKYAPVLDGAGGIKWEQGCYFPKIKQIGEECTNDEECMGGTCLKDYFATGYCSRRCETGGCPTGSACVQLKGTEFWCSGECVGDKCALDVPTDRFDVTCKVKQVRGGGAANVCSKT